MKITSIVGARPQFIKISPLCREFDKYRGIRHSIIHTGQHYDYEMSKIFFDELSVPKPHRNLGVGSASHGRQTALMLERIEQALAKDGADLVIVYGDTNSTLAGALAAAKMQIPLAHVEAGLRSYRLDMPEEINRVLTDHISTLLLCPTENAVSNLKKEGIRKGAYLVGDLMYENLLLNLTFARKRKIISKLGLSPKGYFLLTVHRQENADNVDNLKSILSAVASSTIKTVFPVHPRTRKMLGGIKYFKKKTSPQLLFIDPVGYLDMLALADGACKIVTDSGGLQKEAYWLGTPCITLRKETEWVETVNDKRNVLTGVDRNKIIKAINSPCVKTRGHRAEFTGISRRIIEILLANFRKTIKTP